MSTSARSLLPELGSDPVAAVRQGVPTTALDRLQSHLQVSDTRLAPLLGVSPRTLRRRRTAGTLTPHESDRLLLVAEVVAFAQRALDGVDPAREWLRAPHSLLNGGCGIIRLSTGCFPARITK